MPPLLTLKKESPDVCRRRQLFGGISHSLTERFYKLPHTRKYASFSTSVRHPILVLLLWLQVNPISHWPCHSFGLLTSCFYNQENQKQGSPYSLHVHLNKLNICTRPLYLQVLSTAPGWKNRQRQILFSCCLINDECAATLSTSCVFPFVSSWKNSSEVDRSACFGEICSNARVGTRGRGRALKIYIISRCSCFFLYHILGSGTAHANVNRREAMEYKVGHRPSVITNSAI